MPNPAATRPTAPPHSRRPGRGRPAWQSEPSTATTLPPESPWWPSGAFDGLSSTVGPARRVWSEVAGKAASVVNSPVSRVRSFHGNGPGGGALGQGVVMGQTGGSVPWSRLAEGEVGADDVSFAEARNTVLAEFGRASSVPDCGSPYDITRTPLRLMFR
jgi:hypothetical protein